MCSESIGKTYHVLRYKTYFKKFHKDCKGISSTTDVTTNDANNTQTTKGKGNVFRDMFQLTNLKEGFVSVLKKRDHRRRTFVILLVLVITY